MEDRYFNHKRWSGNRPPLQYLIFHFKGTTIEEIMHVERLAERHFDQYDKEMENPEKSGDNYLALQSIERTKTIAAGRPAE